MTGFNVSQQDKASASSTTVTASSGVIAPGEYSIDLPATHGFGMSPNCRTIVPTSYGLSKMRDVVWEANTYGYLPPGMAQSGFMPDGGSCRSVNVLISDAFFKTASRGVVNASGADIRNLVALDDPVGAHLMQSLGAIAAQGDANDWPLLMDTIGASLVLRAMQMMGASVKANRLMTGRMTMVMDYVNDNLDQALSLDDLSQVAGLSLSHFARQFKRETGESPHEYVLRTRVNQAVRLTRSGAASLSIIALSCGFSSQAHMTRAVKIATGSTPGQHQVDAGVRAWRRQE